MGLKTMSLGFDASVIGDRSGQKMVLDVWIGNAGAAPDKPATFKMICGAQPVFAEYPLHPNQRFREQVHG